MASVIARYRCCRRFLGVALALLCLPLLLSPGARAENDAQSAVALEKQVKAAFLYKFMAYVEWPAGRAADGPLKIGVIGADEVAHELMRLVRLRGSQDRPVTVHRLRPTEAPTGLHALFIGGGYGQSPEPLLRQAQQESVLTVTENEQAFAHGSVINFKLLDGRVRFDISLPAAQRHNLRLSSRLIAVAHEVHRREP